MRKEIPQWNPSRWSFERARRYRNHVMDYTILFLQDMLGNYDGTLAFAELRGELADAESARLFAAARVKTIGQGGE